MSVKPNERIEFFLAKIAGEDIDTNTLTPPGAINATERALDGISERLNDIDPEYTATDAGKVLTVNESGTGVEWAEGGSDLPAYTAADAGKALTVNESGNGVEWTAGSIYQITATETDLGDDTYLFRLDKTFLEIYTAMQNKMFCVIAYVDATSAPTDYFASSDVVREVSYDQSTGAIVVCGIYSFTCSTINDYPQVVTD